MAWSQSHFLQALGWATLNSFWQMGLLWCMYIAACYLFKLSSQRKYQLSVGAMVTGFAWFSISFLLFYKNSFVSSVSFFEQEIHQSNSLLNVCLIAASVAYLCLLIFPSYKLFRNWKFVQVLKKQGLHKADLEHRLFTQKITAHLGIAKKVKLFVSELVASPLTVGYLKPIILLPVAVMNNLTTSQVEAILLHELSHIRRYDYLVNFIISIINTLLYFNPFVKQFMKEIEAERENCCDELVLQFGYDKISYASALLTLEKTSAQHHILVLGATGKKNLLTRIEKIVGMEKKKGYRLAQLVPVLAAIVCILAFNSVMVIKDSKKSNNSIALNSTFVNPFYAVDADKPEVSNSTILLPAGQQLINNSLVAQSKPATNHIDNTTVTITENEQPSVPVAGNYAVQAGFDEIDGSLTTDQKQQVQKTVDATRKVITTMQWKEVENTIADVMTSQEKAVAKQQYMKEVEGVDWNNLSKNLKANYDKVDWDNINNNLGSALTKIQIDSIQQNYTLVLTQLDKAELQITSKAKTTISPLPDESLTELKQAKKDVQAKIELLKKLNSKNVIHL